MTGRQEIRREQVLVDFNEKRKSWNLKEKALDRTVWRTRLGRSCGPFPKTHCGMRECEQCCQDTNLSQSYQSVNSLITLLIWLLVGDT